VDIDDDSRSDVGQLPVVAIGNVAIHALLLPIHQKANDIKLLKNLLKLNLKRNLHRLRSPSIRLRHHHRIRLMKLQPKVQRGRPRTKKI
jgi:hypothetical protein